MTQEDKKIITLEEEIKSWIPPIKVKVDEDVSGIMKHIREWGELIARHFAEWGAEHAREQMMEEAVDATVHLEPGAFPVIEIGVGRFGLKVRDKVKIIIVKEED